MAGAPDAAPRPEMVGPNRELTVEEFSGMVALGLRFMDISRLSAEGLQAISDTMDELCANNPGAVTGYLEEQRQAFEAGLGRTDKGYGN